MDRPAIPLQRRVGIKLVLVTTMLLVIAVGATTAFVARLATVEIRRNVGLRNLQLAKRVAEEIDLFIENATQNLGQLAAVIELFDRRPWAQDVLLENYVLTTKDFKRIVLIDANASILADSILGRISVSEFDPDAIRCARTGEAYVPSVTLDADGMPGMTMVLPTRSIDGRERTLVAELQLRRLWTMIEDITVGAKSFAFVVTRDGTLVAHSDKMEIIKKRPASPQAAATPGAGDAMEAGFRVESPVSSTEWTVVIEQPSSEAFLPVSLLIRRSFVLVFLILMVATYLAFFSVRMISRPLDALLRGTVIIGRGATDYRIPIDSHDEFGILSRSFNSMVENLQERAAALEESERKYRIVTENVNDIIFSLDARGRFTFLNRRAEQVLGYHLNEMIGKLFVDFLSMDEMAAKALGFIKGISDHSRFLLPAEIPFIAKSGEEVILECEAVPIHEPSGEVRIHGVARDITERRRLEEKLRRTEKLSALGEIVSGVAHELRNAVSGITASMEMIRARGDGAPGKDLDRVLGEALRAQRIVHGLLDFSKDQAPSIHPCSLNAVIEDSLELCRKELEEGKIEVTMSLDPYLPEVLANPDQLRQVFLNLILNAIQAMRNPAATGITPKSSHAVLSMRSRAEGGVASVTVSDTGPGIQKKNLARIFDPFFTTKGRGKGTGLGLSISLGIVQAHGGDIRVQSVEGWGAIFSVELPVVTRMEEQQRETVPAQRLDLTGKRILVVEDEDSIREFIGNFLQSYGCAVDSAADVRAAVSFLSGSVSHDLVISDFRMPEIDGQGLYEWIRSNKPDLLRRLIYVTGDSLNPMTRSFLRRTGVPYLLKPIGSLSLVRAVWPMLGREAGATSSR